MKTTSGQDALTTRPAHTPGPWREGKWGASIVSDTPVEGVPGDFDAQCLEYYGGYVVAESIAPCNRPIIMAAPDMLAQLKKLRNWLIGNAEILERAAKTHARFRSVADEELANAKNYRATAKAIDVTIAKAGGQ